MIDERPYRCILCGMGYSQRRNMDRHVRLSHYHYRDVELTSGAQSTTLIQHYRDGELTELISCAQSTTLTQHTESLHGITSTVSTVNSSQGTAIVTTVQSATSLVATTTISQASGTVTVTHPSVELRRDPGNECPICFDSLNDGETIATPCCEAKFHIRCLRTVQTNSGDVFPCPHCRGTLTRDWLNGVILSIFCNYL